MATRKDYYTLLSLTKKGYKYGVVVTSLTERDEELLDEGKTIVIERGNCIFTISPKDIYVYGEIDFNNKSEDMSVIADLNWFDTYQDHGLPIPARYHYKTHTATSRFNVAEWVDTTCPEKAAQYAHGFIGKPQRTIIFKSVYGKVKSARELLR